MCETGMVLEEVRFHLKHLKGWMRERAVPTPLAQFHAKSFVVPEPYGVALIISPWNDPLQLALEPLVGAIAGGNCAVVKPSAYAVHTSRAVKKLLEECFPQHYVSVVEGGRAENQALLEQSFDTIFFTGSVAVGRHVMEMASKNLTPVSLELGGKSPCIVDETADLKTAARRLAFGKYLNAGQTCVAPDYLFVHHSVQDAFMAHLVRSVEEFFPGGDFSTLPTIINDKHYQRLMGLLQGQKVVLGGKGNAASRRIQPTILADVSRQSPVMQEEIFGPILPVIPYQNLDTVIEYVSSQPKPLALYLFTTSPKNERRVLQELSFGGGCINDTIIHLATPHMGFGGVGQSGMGSYHGKYSFDTFTHYKSMVRKSNWIDLPLRYRPYTPLKDKIVRQFLK